MTYTTLSPPKKKQARQLIKDIESSQISVPQDIVQWECHSTGGFSATRKEKQMVKPTNIKGVYDCTLRERLVPGRLKKILTKLIEREWKETSRYPPDVVKVSPGEYYIFRDGIHRAIAHKFLNIEIQVLVHELDE